MAHLNMSELLFAPFDRSNRPLTVSEVARILRYDPATVRRKARCGEIPGGFQIGGRGGWRFKRKVFETWWNQLAN